MEKHSAATRDSLAWRASSKGSGIGTGHAPSPMRRLHDLPTIRRAAWMLMVLAAFVVGALNYRFIWIDVRQVMHRAADHLGHEDFALFLHLWTAPLILVTGALLFASRLRTRHPAVHRWAGRCYIGTVLATSIATLWLALHESEGPLTVFGFGFLSILWFGTAAIAWIRALQRRFPDHGEWMVRNYALTLTNVTFRAEMHILLLCGVRFHAVYEPLRVLQWIPNLIIAEILIRTRFPTRRHWRDLLAMGPTPAAVTTPSNEYPGEAVPAQARS